MFKLTLIYFAIIFLPSFIVGLWQLFDDNILKEKYETKLSKEEIENKILSITSLPRTALDSFDEGFQQWCDNWSKNDMSSSKKFCEEKYHEINKLQIEGFIDTNQTRHIELSKDHDLSFLNIDIDYHPKICLTKDSIKHQRELKENAPIRLRLKYEGEIADYQTEKTEDGKDAFVIGNQIPYERNIILDFYLINKAHPELPDSWKFIGTKAYNSYFAMREKHYPKFWDKILKRNKTISL